MVLLSGDGNGWVNPLEQGKSEWRKWHDEWAGAWKKQQSLGLRRSFLPTAHGGAVGLGASCCQHRLGSLPLKMSSDLGCSGRTWQDRSGWGCSGQGRSARPGREAQHGSGAEPWLPAPPLLCACPGNTTWTLSLSPRAEGWRCPDRVFY